MNKFKKNTVKVDSIVKKSGMKKIYSVLFAEGLENVGRRELDEITGGRERVNAKGKMTKRIKRNLRRDYDITLSDKAVQAIGNIMDQNSLSAREYIVEYTTDLEGTVGGFGDGGSCFQSGSECHHHLLAMQDHHSHYTAVRVYRANGDRLARAWAYSPQKGETVLFNGYGIPLDKIALLAARLEGQEPRPVQIVNSDIYINDGEKCYAIGGETTRYNVWANTEEYEDNDDMSWCSLCDCNVYYDDLYHVGTDSLCSSCFDESYQTCNHCLTTCQRSDNPLFAVFVNGVDHHVCGRCKEGHYQQCDECNKYHRTNTMVEDGQHAYCNNCAVKMGATACDDCATWTMPDHTHSITFSNKEYAHKNRSVCESCRAIYYECDHCQTDLPYQTCPTCDSETVARTPNLDFSVFALDQMHAAARHRRRMETHRERMFLQSIESYARIGATAMVEKRQASLNASLEKMNLAQARIDIYHDARTRAGESNRQIFERDHHDARVTVKVTI